jgi:hypothetical protein
MSDFKNGKLNMISKKTLANEHVVCNDAMSPVPSNEHNVYWR